MQVTVSRSILLAVSPSDSTSVTLYIHQWTGYRGLCAVLNTVISRTDRELPSPGSGSDGSHSPMGSSICRTRGLLEFFLRFESKDASRERLNTAFDHDYMPCSTYQHLSFLHRCSHRLFVELLCTSLSRRLPFCCYYSHVSAQSGTSML